MLLFKRVEEISRFLHLSKQNSQRLGFVPTMGALHEGHLSLIQQSKAACDLTVCSIFVNPTQFNEASDLDKYPRREAADIAMLVEADCDILFLPEVGDMYPADYAGTPEFDFGLLDKVMEGAHRTGHFAGVAQVLLRFLEILQPDAMFMGQKDLQQFLIVRSMLEQLNSDVELVLCPIVREPSGLAMSSRNRRLSPEQQELAANIYQTLLAAKKWRKAGFRPPEIQNRAMLHLKKIKGFQPEYIEVVETKNLQPIDRFQKGQETAICAAVWVGEVRLIDNLLFE
ncbi:MAG: pantoate--beta-alanine ligase [Saprospiraceae bacterium]|nr:pantoate--beta-alanine ligase [Saprospiraceae bacterium]